MNNYRNGLGIPTAQRVVPMAGATQAQMGGASPSFSAGVSANAAAAPGALGLGVILGLLIVVYIGARKHQGSL